MMGEGLLTEPTRSASAIRGASSEWRHRAMRGSQGRVGVSQILAQGRELHKRKGYRAYLLRCWQEGEEWRFSLREVSGARRQYGFSGLDALVTFLQREVMAEGENAPVGNRTR